MSTIISTRSDPPVPTVRFGQKDRGRAFRTYAILEQHQPGRWHVGIASNLIVMLDVDSKDLWQARAIAKIVREHTGAQVGIFKTNRGFHLIAHTVLASEDEWRRITAQIIYKCHRAKLPLDTLQASLSLKWAKSVLRITPKNGGQPPRLIEVYY